mgnify:CR=1 FL=1
MKTRLIVSDLGIIRHQEIQKAVANLIVGEAQGIKIDFLVVILDSEVTALVNHGKRIPGIRTIL